MKPDAKEKNILELLQSQKYYIDDYQREYKWEERQIKELILDLTEKFLENFNPNDSIEKIETYGTYFLGSIIISKKENKEYIVDGQQRITSITLLLIFLYNQLKNSNNLDKCNVLHSLIYSQDMAKNSYNLNVNERNDCMDYLFYAKEDELSLENKNESIVNLVNRYKDIQIFFPEELYDCILNFTWWLIKYVYLVKITSYSDDEAYTIFETMNDRGLSLDSTEMLKGFLLANIGEGDKRNYANDIWKKKIKVLNEMGKEEASDFFKNWYRAKYAITQRIQNKKEGGYSLQDFEIIGNAYHKWIRDNKEKINLNKTEDFYGFIANDFEFYSNLYIKIRTYEKSFFEEYKEIYFNAHNNFTLQILCMMSAIKINDSEETINIKIKLISKFLDIYIARSLVNFRVLGYSSIIYKIFAITKEIRNKEFNEIKDFFQKTLVEHNDNFEGMSTYRLNKQNRVKIHYLLARITYFIEKESGRSTSFEEYVNKGKNKPFEIEHIIPDKFEEYKNIFDSEDDFENTRNKLGNLILMQRGTNQSLGDSPYEQKRIRYSGENLLAQSLCENSVVSNPNYTNFIKKSGLNFRPYKDFGKNEILDRNELYRDVFEYIWNVENLTI